MMAKGFKDKDGKFRPTENKKGVRKSRDQNAKTQGVKLNSGVRKSRSDIKPKLPAYQTPEWDKLKEQVEKRFNNDFNSVRLENLNKINQNWFEDVVTTEPRMDDIKDYFGESRLTNAKFNKNHTEDEIEDAKNELLDQQREVMWGTIFEASDEFVAKKILDNSDAVINDAGFTIIDVSRSNDEGAYTTGVFLGVNGAGYDFYEQHWVPLYRIFGWI